jgi:hypothetical protein
VNLIQEQEEEEASSEYFEEIATVPEDVQIVKEQQHERKAYDADVNETIDDEEIQEFKEDHLII